MNELKVGILAILTVVAVIYMSLKVTSNQSGFGKYVTYRTIISNASGIFPKTPIKVAGISAGRIKNIELQGNQALITFEVLEVVKIVTGSKLVIKSVGLLGDKYLEIIIGEGADRLKSMAFIESQEGGGFEKMAKEAGAIMKDVKAITAEIKASLVAKEGEEGFLKKLFADVKEISASTKDITAKLKALLSDNEGKINELMGNLTKFSENLAIQMDPNKKESVLVDVKKILADAAKLSADMKAIVGDIKNGKGTVGQLLVEEEIADEVRETLAGVKKLVNKVDSIRTELSFYTGVNSEAGGSSEAGLRIFPSPERFYMLGMATSELGPEKKNESTTSINGGAKTVEERTVRERDTYRFNVQLGRRIHDWSFRGGLIESAGGLGVDYDFDRIGTILSLEAFDYRDDLGVNLRLSTETHLWNVFYGKLSCEEVLNDETSFTMSAGLRFTDEDLKGLLGFFL